MQITKLIKEKHFKYKEISDLTGIPVTTISNWRNASPAIDKAVKVLNVLGYKAPADPMQYLWDRYKSLQSEQKHTFWHRSGIGRSTWEEWRAGRMPSLYNYIVAVQTMDEILNLESWVTKVVKDGY